MSGTLSLRIVIQLVAGSAGSPPQYRLIAYSNAWAFPAATFSTAAELLEKLEAAEVPAELRPQLEVPTPNETKIIYSADLVLSDYQLKILRLVS